MLLKKLSSKILYKPSTYSLRLYDPLCLSLSKHALLNQGTLIACRRFSQTKLNSLNDKNDDLKIKFTHEDYDEKGLLAINKILSMDYQKLYKEYKKHANRPQGKSKDIILQYLIDQIPKATLSKKNIIENTKEKESGKKASKEVKPTSSTASIASIASTASAASRVSTLLTESEESTKSKESTALAESTITIQTIDIPIIKFRNKDIYPEELEYQVSENKIKKVMNQSHFYGRLSQHISINSLDPPNVSGQNVLPFIEKYHRKQIDTEIKNMKIVDIRREFDQFLNRSEFFYNQNLASKLKRKEKEILHSKFTDMVLIDKDYCIITKNNFRAFSIPDRSLKKFNILLCLEALKFLDNPVNYWNTTLYLQNLPKNGLMYFWKYVFESVDRYDLKNLELILRMMHKLRKEYGLHFSDPSLEANIMEKISYSALMLLNTDNSNQTLESLANLLNSLNMSRKVLTSRTIENMQIIGEIMIQKYINGWFGVPINQLNISINKFFEAFIALINNNQIKTLVPIFSDLFQKAKDYGLRYIDKVYLNQLLMNLSNLKIRINDDIGDEICENVKLMKNLTLFEIYLIIHIFKESKVQFGKIYNHLYTTFFSLLNGYTVIKEYKNIIITSKILNYIMEYHLNDHNQLQLQSNINKLMILIENSLEATSEKIEVSDLLDLSATFTPHLNIPDYIFDKILKHIGNLKLNNETRPKIIKFVSRLLDKLEPKYTLNIYLNSFNVEFNDKMTNVAISLMRNLAKKFIETNLLSYMLLNIQMLTNTQLVKAILHEPKERKGFFELIAKQIIAFSSNSNLHISNLVQIMKFLSNNVEEINSNLIVIINNRLIPQFLTKQTQTKDRFNEILPWIYYIVNTLSSCKSDELTTANSKQKDILMEKIKEFIMINIMNPFCENMKLTIQQIIYDRNVQQRFNANTFNTNFNNLEYLLPVLDKANIRITPTIEKNIILQYPRCVKLWNGEFVIKNLILFDKLKIHAPEVFELSSQNLFSLFLFYNDTQMLKINKEILDELTIVSLLKAYSNQEQALYYKPDLITDQTVLTKLPIGSHTYITLGIFLYTTFHVFLPHELIKIIRYLGPNRSVYPEAIIEKFEMITFTDLTFKDALNIKLYIPKFIKIKQIDEMISTQLQSNYKEDITASFEILFKEKIWNEIIAKEMKEQLNSSMNIQGFKKYLEYYAKYGPIIHDFEFVISNIRAHEKQLSNEDLMNFLIIAWIYNNPKDSINNNNNTSITISEDIKTRNNEYIRLIANQLLNSEFFYYFENEYFDENGRLFKLQYFSSLELKNEAISYSYKILPKNKHNKAEHIKNSSLNTQQSIYAIKHDLDDENLADYAKIYEGDISQEEFYEMAKKYYIYSLYREEINISSNQHQEMISSFILSQSSAFDILKSQEDYADFLIDFTTILNKLDIEYKTNYRCENTQILIDIAIPSHHLAFVYVDDINILSQQDEKSGKTSLLNDNLTHMKGGTLKRLGNWNVINVVFREWNELYKSRHSKEEYIMMVIQEKSRITYDNQAKAEDKGVINEGL